MILTSHRRCTPQKKADHSSSLTEQITPSLFAELDDVIIDLLIDNVRTVPLTVRKRA